MGTLSIDIDIPLLYLEEDCFFNMISKNENWFTELIIQLLNIIWPASLFPEFIFTQYEYG